MAFVRNVTTSNVITNVNNITIELGPHLAGDAIVMLVAKDTTTGGNLSTPAGWTKLGEEVQGTVIRSACYINENVSGSETNPNVTSTDTDTWSALAIVLGGVATTGVVGAQVQQNFNAGTAHQGDLSSLTTTAANSLVMWLYGSDGFAQVYMADNLKLLSYDDGVGCSAVGWYSTYPDIGATATKRIFTGSTEQWAGFVLEILDGSTGNDVEGYLEGGIQESGVINTLHGNEINTYLPAGLPSGLIEAPAVTNLAGLGISISNTLVDQADANSVPYSRAMRIEADRLATSGAGVSLQADITGGLGPIDVSGVDRHIHMILHHVDLKKHSLGGKANNFGTAVILSDNAGNWKAFGVDGRDANRRLASPIAGPVIIDPSSTNNVLEENGTFDETDLRRFTFAGKADKGNNYYTYICNIFIADPYVVLGGSTGIPASLDDLVDFDASKGHGYIQRSGDLYTMYGIIAIGSGIDEVAFNMEGKTLNFPPQDNGVHVENGHLGMIVDLTATSTLNARSATITSSSPYRFDIQSTQGTSVDFSGATIKNADPINLNGPALFDRTTFQNCGEINPGTAILTGGAVFKETMAARAITITSQAELDNIANSTFDGNAIAITVDIAGTINLVADNITFVNNTTDVEYTGTGILTWNNTNGSDASTELSPSGTVILQSTAEIKITVRDALTFDAIEGARLLLEADIGGPLTPGTNVLAGLTDNSGIISTTFILAPSIASDIIINWENDIEPNVLFEIHSVSFSDVDQTNPWFTTDFAGAGTSVSGSVSSSSVGSDQAAVYSITHTVVEGMNHPPTYTEGYDVNGVSGGHQVFTTSGNTDPEITWATSSSWEMIYGILNSEIANVALLDNWTQGIQKLVSTGANRILIVAINYVDSSSANVDTVEFGGQTLSQVAESGDFSSSPFPTFWFGYLPESGIQAASPAGGLANQPVTGKVRRGTTSPYYKEGPIASTITAQGLDITVLLVRDE